MKNKNVLVLIPARYASTRFPGKPLAMIRNKSMIERIYTNCFGQQDYEVCVVTDDDRIEEHVKNFGGRVVRVDDNVRSGSERIFLAWKRYYGQMDFDYIVNVQGDEPLLLKEDLFQLIDYHSRTPFDIATVVTREKLDDRFYDSNNVKALYQSSTGKCHFFSRAPIPHARNHTLDEWYLHVGIYSYTPSALLRFSEAAASYYEKIESLEQLRAIENGLQIGAICMNKRFVGVDTNEDLRRIEGVLSGQENK